MTATATAAGLPPALSHALEKKGYDTLTEVQDAMLGGELAGRDLLVSAQTGSGKTVAFGLAIGADLLGDSGERLPAADKPIALVVAPTRELALQVAQELTWLYREAGARVATCVGGMDMRTERQALGRGAHIVVGTPGRLVDHISRNSLRLDALRAVVLDEADEMLNLGFREELEAILEACPEGRRTLMFSATVGGGIGKLAGQYQRDALRITATGPTRQHDDIAYKAFVTAQHDAERAIINTLLFHDADNAIVFCSTRAAVARLTSRLANRGFSVVSLSGELNQKERSNALQAMRDGRARVCVATDVAARGIDLPGLELVIHAELPKNREGLLHRSGRTGRAGRKGTSVLIVPPRARRHVERLLGDVKITAEWRNPPSADEVRAKDDERLLTAEALTEPAEMTELAQKIAETYSAEHLAAAIVRMYSDKRSAPEEIAEVWSEDQRPERKQRTEIVDGVWVTLSVGRANRAEPRWLLPMLCKSGPMAKAAIGAIRVRETETFVQIDPKGAEKFLARIENGGQLEDGIEVKRADGPPGPEQRGPRPPRQARPERPHPKTGTRDKKPYRDAAPKAEGSAEPMAQADAPAIRSGDDDKFKRKPRAKDKVNKSKGKPKGPIGRQGKADGTGPRKRQGAAKAFARAKRTGE